MVKESYNLIESQNQIEFLEKIKTLILIRLHLCQKYKEAVRSSISLTAIPKNSREISKNFV